jgi:hypothetical protein
LFSRGGSGTPEAAAMFSRSPFVWESGELVDEHQRMLRGDFEFLAARPAHDFVVAGSS